MIKVRLLVVGLGISCLFLAGCGKPVKEEVLPQDITDFAVLFQSNCSGCHGVNGKNGPAPQLNDALFLRFIPKEEIHRLVEQGRPGTLMPAFGVNNGGPLYPKQVDAIVDGIEQNWAKPVDLRGATLPPYSAEGGDAVHGQKVFRTACFICHFEKGVGGSITNRQFLGLISDQSVRTTIVVGRPQFGMPDWQHRGRVLNDQDITDVVAYIASLRPGAAIVKASSEEKAK
jgi:mono/diheme cytochrome c family protein